MSYDNINAFTPPVIVLDKLAEIVAMCQAMIFNGLPNDGLAGLVNDEGVGAWIKRMRDLERIPPANETSFTGAIRQQFNTPGPTQTMIDDAGPPSDYIDTRLKEMVYQPLSLDDEVVDTSRSGLSLSLEDEEDE